MFDLNGNPLRAGAFEKGLKEGVWVEWKSEKLSSKGPYKHDKKEGAWIAYQETGNLLDIYNEGVLLRSIPLGKADLGAAEEVVVEYYPGSSKISEAYMINNRTFEKNGFFCRFYKDGKPEQIGAFKNDQPDGRWVWNYPNNQPAANGFFADGKREGDFSSCDVGGKPIEAGKYQKGLKEGAWKERAGDGQEHTVYYRAGQIADAPAAQKVATQKQAAPLPDAGRAREA